MHDEFPEVDHEATLPVTDVRLTIPTKGDLPGLLAWAQVTIGGVLVINSIRLVQRPDHKLIVAMPNRHYRRACPSCRRTAEERCRFCPHCGAMWPPLVETRPPVDQAHAISRAMRQAIEDAVFRAYFGELAAREAG